jgi:hypothetical protein
VVCVVPCIIAFIAFFINGTDYFIGGMIGITSGPVLYYIWKRMYGGLAKKDPVHYPLNPKTKLAVGDTRRISFNFAVLSLMGFIAYPWLNWFEGDWWGEWGPEYYLETYGTGFLSDFYGMVNGILITAIVFAVIAVVLYFLSMKIEPKKSKIKAIERNN